MGRHEQDPRGNPGAFDRLDVSGKPGPVPGAEEIALWLWPPQMDRNKIKFAAT